MHDNTITMSEVFNQPSKHRHNLKHRFEIIKSLGSGTYGKVKLAIDKKTGQKVAIKSIAKRKVANDENLTRIRREIEIMASLKHRHIVQILEVFENKDKIILVQEFADGGELYDYISSKGKLTEKEARLLFRQIVSAVHYLHENGVVHRDLKLENILLDRHGMIKLADFGLSNTWQHNKLLKTYCGSPLYASPEIVNGRPYYGPEVDCWSLGVLLYTLVYGAMPFDGTDLYKLREQISTGDYFKRPSKQSDASGLIARLLTVNPARRANIIDAAAHWWTNYEQKDLLALLELSEVSEKRTSDYFDDEDHEPVTVAFDSSKKPKKSILKNKKISGGDSGCGLSDAREGEISLSELSSPLDDIASPKTQSVKTVLLKADKKAEKSKRQSISSNSSADTLDFSYDSSSSGASDPLVVFEDSLKNRTTRLNQSRFHQALASPITSSVVYSCSV